MIYEPLPIGKVCTVCQVWKPFAALTKDRTRKGGIRPLCYACHQAKDRLYNDTHRAQRLERSRQRYNRLRDQLVPKRHAAYQRDKAKVTENRRRAYHANPEKFRERTRQNRRANPEKSKRINARWNITHREHRRAANNRRYARKQGLPDTFSISDWNTALEYWHSCCAYCGNPPGLLIDMRLTADHLIPLNNPDCPGTVPSNIVPACQSCNSSKSHYDLREWLVRRFGKQQARRKLTAILDYQEWLKRK